MRANMAKLTIITGPQRSRTIELAPAHPTITLGRESCDLVLADAAVSRTHAELSFRRGRWFLKDMDSSNGTFLNEQRITTQIPLANEDQIRCGATVLLFESADARRDEAPPPLPEPDRRDETLVGLTFGSLVPKSSARRKEQAAAAGFAALNISHGIKNLLQTVTSGREVVDCAFKINDIQRARRGWSILNRSLDQINRLILDLLKFSRDTTPIFKSCPLNEFLAGLIRTVQPEVHKKHAAITLEPDEQVGDVPIDPDLIGEAFLNLILNAVEAVRPHHGAIRITTRADRPANRALITFQDNGCGIENTEIIFEPFHSAGKKTGTGLGLPIAQKIIRRHNGDITVQSRPGQGAVFTVALPLSQPSPPSKENVP